MKNTTLSVFVVVCIVGFVVQAYSADCTITGATSGVCAGASSLTANVPVSSDPLATYAWSISANGAISGPSNQNSVNYSANNPGLLTLSIHVNEPTFSESCDNTLQRNVYSRPIANILANGSSTSSATVCVNVSLPLDGNPSGGSGSYSSHTWTGDISALSNPNIQSPSFTASLSGTYNLTYTVLDSNNCSAFDAITITVYTNPISDILIAGTATPSANVCAGAGLSLNGNPSGGSGSFVSHLWTGSGAVYLSSATIQNPTFNSTTASTYTLIYTATDSYGCQASDTVSILVYPRPIPNILANGVSRPSDWLCPGELLNLNGNPSGGTEVFVSHVWSGNVAPLSATNIQSPTFQTTTTGVYNLTYTVMDDRGCIGSDSIQITVANPTVNISVNNTPVPSAQTCSATTLYLHGNPSGGSGSYSHSWTGDTAPLSSTIVRNPTFNTTTTGTYNLTYRVTDSQTCFATDTLAITVHPTPVANILAAGTPMSSAYLCQNEALSLNGNPSEGSGVYTNHSWSGPGALFLSSTSTQFTIFNCSVNGLFSVIYTVTDNRGCSHSDIISIRVENPDSDILADGIPASSIDICSGEGLQLDGNPSTGTLVYTSHQWTGDTAYLSETAIQAPVFYGTAPGIYNLTYTVTDSENCPGIDAIQITVHSPPTADAGIDALIAFGDSSSLDGSDSSCSGGCSYQWRVLLGDEYAIDSGETSAICQISPDELTLFELTVTDAAGCEDFDFVIVAVSDVPLPPVPSISILGILLSIATISVILVYRVRHLTCRNKLSLILVYSLVFLGAQSMHASVDADHYNEFDSRVIRFVAPGSASPGAPYSSWETASHTIQTAINASSTGDIIYVDNGIYSENLVINKDISLISWCREPNDCIITPPTGSVSPAISINDPTPSTGVITLRGFKIMNGSKGVYISGNQSSAGNFPVISGCIIANYTTFGVHAFQGSYICEFNTIVNCNVGIFHDTSNTNSKIQYNIIAYSATYGVQCNTVYLYFDNNCYYENGVHVFGSPIAICDEWSATLPDGVDPLFVNYLAGDYHLSTGSPCIDYNPSFSFCDRTMYDQDESPYDLGAYGGFGLAPSPPFIDLPTRFPVPGTQHISANADISFNLWDSSTAGIDLASLRVYISDPANPTEIYAAADCDITEYPIYGEAPTQCANNGFMVHIPGASHLPFSDFSYVRVSVVVNDLCPIPNPYSHYWHFFADDLNAPSMLTDHYPPQGGVNIPQFGPISIGFSDAGIGIDHNSLQLTLNGDPVSLNLSDPDWMNDRVEMFPIPKFTEGSVNNLQVRIADYYGNLMPLQTITFTCGSDIYPPFVPGVTNPSSPEPRPSLAESPSPAPGDDDVLSNTPVIFTLQDFENILDLTNMVVRVQSGVTNVYYRFEDNGTDEVFQVSGNPYALQITCFPLGSWLIGEVNTVTISGARDTAMSPNTQSPASYSFTTIAPPVPDLSTIGLTLLLIGIGICMFKSSH